MLIIVTCFYGCGEIKGAEETIILPIDKDPEYLDPQIISYVGSKNIIANCFEGLVALDEEGKIVPAVAKSWEVSPDGLKYTFKLREDAKWRVSTSSGNLLGENYKETFDTTVTAYDFEFAIQRAVKPETKSPGAVYLYSIKNAKSISEGKTKLSKLGVKAKDRFTLEIILERADPDFLYTLLESACMPCNEEFFNATRGRYGLSVKYLIYNGPFYINNWADDASVTLRKSDTYYGKDSVMPRSLYFSINNEQNTRLKKLQDDVYTIAPLTLKQANEFTQKKKNQVKAFNSSCLSLVFNCEDTALKNVNIRRAIVSSMDLSVLKNALGEITAKGIVPSSHRIGTLFYREFSRSIEPYSNPKPQELFLKGLDAIDENDIEVTVLCSKDNEATVRSLMQSWQSTLGIAFGVFVEAVDEYELKARVESGEYQIALCDTVYEGNTAFSAVHRFTSSHKDNIANYASEKYDELVSDIKLASGIDNTESATRKAEQYLIKSAVIVPLYDNQIYYGLDKGVSGVIFSLSGDVLYLKNTLAA